MRAVTADAPQPTPPPGIGGVLAIDGYSDARFLDVLGPDAAAEIERHQQQRRDWSYHDILSREVLAEAAGGPPIDLDPAVAMAFVGNLLVEKGHAEYDRITAERFECHPEFRRWKNLWIAEEEPHGAAMLEWGKARGVFDPAVVHAGIQAFLSTGLSLTFTSAPHGLAYAALQERATRLTHLAVKRGLPTDETAGRRILSNIVADEERHERFYSNMVLAALTCGDAVVASAQVVEIARAALAFEMPGIEHDIPDGAAFAEAYRSTGAFSFEALGRDVVLPLAGADGPWRAAIDELDLVGSVAEQCRAELHRFTEELAGLERERQFVLRFMRGRRRIDGIVGVAS